MNRLFALAILFSVSVGLSGCSDRAAALLYGEDDKEDNTFYVNEGSGTQVIGDDNSFSETSNVNPAPTPTATP
jgi:hypothetical protein